MRYLFLIGIIYLVACNQTRTESKKTDPIKTDTVVLKKDSIVQPKTPVPLKPLDRKFNDIARFIAGMPADSGSVFSSKENDKHWKTFAAAFDQTWAKIDTLKIKKYSEWSKQELVNVHAETKTLFYPFAGADVLHAYTLFPNATNYILIGLEPAGSIPDIESEAKDSLRTYYGMINRTLQSVLNFSFFRTKSMAVDFHTRELDGTLPILFVFLARTNNTIIDVKACHISDEGKIAYDPLEKTKSNNAVEITFTNANNPFKAQKIYYFSVNLADQAFSKNNAFQQLINSFDSVSTYLKSASYLMHKSYFSAIRNLILTKSNFILQDDSGIAFKFFEQNQWDIQLYGMYDKPIPLFANMFQQDYKDAFSKPGVKPLTFGIGYDYKKGESNLMLANKKN